MSSVEEPTNGKSDPRAIERLEPRVGVVAIGRNEGERLQRCLSSVCGRGMPVVYVDSGSSDGSVAFARSSGASVVELDRERPFTAARARNAGFLRLLELDPDVEFVQFVDGDCEVAPGWFEAALASVRHAPDIAAVCGRRRERFVDRSIYNLLCDIEWDTPVGEAEACGGDVLMRVRAFEAAGRFNPEVIAGEEPELCVRMRALGFRVLRIDEEMTWHDAAMTEFAQWWKRSIRSGHASAEMAYRHHRAPGSPGVRPTVSNLFWAVGLPLGIVTLTRFGVRNAGWGLWLYPALTLRVYRRARRLGRDHQRALAYSVACTVGKIPETIGAARFLIGVLGGSRSEIIEYKTSGT